MVLKIKNMCNIKVTLPETNSKSTKKHGWLEYSHTRFLLGPGLFSGVFAVSFMEGNHSCIGKISSRSSDGSVFLGYHQVAAHALVALESKSTTGSILSRRDFFSALFFWIFMGVRLSTPFHTWIREKTPCGNEDFFFQN